MRKFESYFSTQLEEYIAYRKSYGYAMKVSTMSHLKSFDQYVKEKNPEGKLLPPSFFLEFRASLKMESTSSNNFLSSICTFFQYLVRRGDYDDNPVKDIPRLPENDVVPFVFTPKEINQLLSVTCRRLRKSPKYYLIDYSRYMAFLLMARCGLRISEPLNLKLYHYRSGEKTLYIEETKFTKDRLIPVPIRVGTEIENYLKVRIQLLCVDNNPYLLVGAQRNKITDNTLRNVFHRAVKDIGLNYPRIVIGKTNFSSPTPHSLRHAFAVNTLKAIRERGRSPQNALPVLAVYLGHKSYENTARYLKVLDARQRHRLLDFVSQYKDEE